MTINIIHDAATNEAIFTDNTGTSLPEVGRLGRGSTDADITYLSLRDASGTKVYVYPTSGGTSLTVTTTRP